MKLKFIITIFLAILIQSNLFGIERYSKGETLFIWVNKLNLRTAPNLNSEVLFQISLDEKIIVDENKYSKEEDFLINNNVKNWEKAITGKWVKVIYKNKTGYLFDAYLSKYSFSKIHDFENHISSDTILNMPGFEIFTRKKYQSKIIKEEGVGNEWGKIIYYIFDLSTEEAILFIKKEGFEYNYGVQKWKVNLTDSTIQMEESDGLNYRHLTIKRMENLTMIVIEHGM